MPGSQVDGWRVPLAFRDQARDTPAWLDWADRAPAVAAELAERWSVRLDGAARWGYMSVVWPVRDGAGRRLALKMGPSAPDITREAAALRGWQGLGSSVDLVAADETQSALLLERLDPERVLEDEPDVDAAVRVIADLLQRQRVPAPDDVPPLAVEVERILAAIEEHAAAKPGLLAAYDVDRARDTLRDLLADLPRRRPWLAHCDAHFENVLHTLPGAEPGWRLIDPLPSAGPLEIEPIAALRNRFGEAAATGDPDRALRRRLAIFTEVLGLDVSLSRRLAQAVAVDNLLWLLPDKPDNRFVAPYRVLAGWRD